MNIGIVTHEYPPMFGGVGHSVQRIAQAVSKSGCKVSVIVIPSVVEAAIVEVQDDQTDVVEEGLVKVYRLSLAQYRPIANKANIYAAYAEWLDGFVRENVLDLLHCFYISNTGFITGLVALENEIPFMVSVRGNDLHKSLFNDQQFAYIRWILERADILTFVNAGLERRAHKIADIHGKTYTFWNSVDTEAFDLNVEPAAQYRDVGRPIVGTAGRFRQKKGVKTLLEAGTLLKNKAKLLLLGYFDKEEQTYWSDCVLPTLENRVDYEVTGKLPYKAMPAYYKVLDVFVLAATHEGCPNVLLEAMLAGCAVVCTDAGAMGDIINASQGGLIARTNDPVDLARCIDELLSDAELRHTMGARNRAFVLDNLSLAHETNHWLNCYKQLLKS